MNCDEVRRRLSLFLDSDCTAETAQDMLRHAESCPSCAERVASETRIEHRLKEILGASAAGDGEAWERAISGLPAGASDGASGARRSPAGRRRAALVLAALSMAAAALLAWLRPWHRELDLALELAAHHQKVLEGKSPLEVESPDPAVVHAFFRGKYLFQLPTCGELPGGMRLAGGRPCYLAGAPTAYYVAHRGETAITVAVFAPEGLDAFPMARERLSSSDRLHCRIGSMEIVAHQGKGRVVAAIGACPREALDALAEAFK
ncbi:MAG: zf-HC2 domain-containing protein [Planctomycetes bacterium]|nr:zf-HC2 domain-containing protein [Planctomycetota bacterium]